MPSKIEWTDETWNPVTGCNRISTGCEHCYAETMAPRLKSMLYKWRNGFEVTLHPDTLTEPARYRKPRKIFVCSMSDLFHKDVPYEFIDKVFETMWNLPRHSFQVLTKRTERMVDYLSEFRCEFRQEFLMVWAGTSVENRRYYEERVPILREARNVGYRFLSIEPLLEDLGDIDLDDIDWVITGGESGPGARPIETDWVRRIRDQCAEQAVPFLFKQWGRNRRKTGRLLDGRTHDDFPIPIAKYEQTWPVPVRS